MVHALWPFAQLAASQACRPAGTESQSPSHRRRQNLSPLRPPGQPPQRRAPIAMTPPVSLKQVQAAHPCGSQAGNSTGSTSPSQAQLEGSAKPQSFDRPLDPTGLDQLVMRSNRQVQPRGQSPFGLAFSQPSAPWSPPRALRGRGSRPGIPRFVPGAAWARWPPDPLAAEVRWNCDERQRFAGRWLSLVAAVCGPHPVLPPLTVPVSALLTGAGGQLRLTEFFRVNPRGRPPWCNAGQPQALLVSPDRFQG